MKRQIITSVLSVCLVLSVLAGCGTQKPESIEVDQETNVEMQASETTTELSTEVSTTEETQAETKEQEETVELDRSAVQKLVADMNAGWNLGNTLDANGVGNTLLSETGWGNPKTTKEMIDAIAAQGFNSIRIPITWAEHMGSAPDYTVDPEWMTRVEEIVNYALDNNMYVMINTHHEPNYWLIPDPEKQEETVEQFCALWKQIAEHFKDYDEHLVFEGMNEVRTRGSEKEWNGGTTEERTVINALNQAFVDTVRSTGGNNETRCLILSTYGHSPSYKALKELVLPQDANIALALHMYTPYLFTFAQDANHYSIWKSQRKDEIVVTMKEVDKFIMQKGIPVIITEFGAENKNNSGEIIKWIDDYLDVMNKYGIPCFWWDNGIYDTAGEKFAIFDRKTCTWYDQAIADELVKKANE